MKMNIDQLLDKYAELILRVGLNFQAGQRLGIGSLHDVYRVPLEAAPLVRIVAAKAYKMGASLVEVFWGDEQIDLIRMQDSESDSLETYPSWIAPEMKASAGRGDARLVITGADPYLYSDIDPNRLSPVQKVRAKELAEAYQFDDQHPHNWCVVNYATPAWAAAVFPDLPLEQAVASLWDYLISFCRLDAPDPIAAWNDHNRDLYQRGQWLTQAQFKSVHYHSPHTDLWIDLPPGHLWVGGIDLLPDGLEFCANLPTEELCTLPDRKGVRGYVQATKPVTYRGMYIEGIRLEFEAGRVVKASAKKGEEKLQKLIETDEGACRLGEVAMVPHSSPISQSELVFHSILLDENASCHIALGNGYRFCLTDGETMDKQVFETAGGNTSGIHFDFMIGSSEMDVDGIDQSGAAHPLLRAGEWAFSVG